MACFAVCRQLLADACGPAVESLLWQGTRKEGRKEGSVINHCGRGPGRKEGSVINHCGRGPGRKEGSVINHCVCSSVPLSFQENHDCAPLVVVCRCRVPCLLGWAELQQTLVEHLPVQATLHLGAEYSQYVITDRCLTPGLAPTG
jgi:hypothetical protein